MAIDMDFTRDVAARCIEMLVEAGYAPQPADDDDAIHTYCGVRHRRVRQRPRRVLKAAYAVPAHLAEGERQLLEKVAAGGDLWPHQSRKIGRSAFEDDMLNDYGIQHFHLGTSQDTKHPNLIAGTEKILLAYVNDDEFYAVGIYKHGEWSKKELLEILHATWPEITEPYRIRGAIRLGRNLTDDEAAKYRAAGVNVPRQLADGTIQMGMGGGINAARGSVAARRLADRFWVHIEALQEEVERIVIARVEKGELPPDAPVRLVWSDDAVYAVPEPPIFKIDLTRHLQIPAL